MKLTKLMAVLLITAAFIYAFSGCGKKEESNVKDNNHMTEMNHDEHNMTNDTTKMVSDGKYFCEMHPLEQSNEPGKCPICKMNLTSKDDYNKKMMEKHEELEGKFAGKGNGIHFEVKTSVLKTWECENTIKKALKNTAGVEGFFIDILDSRIHLYIDKDKTSKKDVEKVISDLGFDANETKANPEAAAKLPDECK